MNQYIFKSEKITMAIVVSTVGKYFLEDNKLSIVSKDNQLIFAINFKETEEAEKAYQSFFEYMENAKE